MPTKGTSGEDSFAGILTSEERNDYAKAIAALRKRFKPLAIEELREMLFFLVGYTLVFLYSDVIK